MVLSVCMQAASPQTWLAVLAVDTALDWTLHWKDHLRATPIRLVISMGQAADIPCPLSTPSAMSSSL